MNTVSPLLHFFGWLVAVVAVLWLMALAAFTGYAIYVCWKFGKETDEEEGA